MKAVKAITVHRVVPYTLCVLPIVLRRHNDVRVAVQQRLVVLHQIFWNVLFQAVEMNWFPKNMIFFPFEGILKCKNVTYRYVASHDVIITREHIQELFTRSRIRFTIQDLLNNKLSISYQTR